jgi:hypothetical protein
MLRSPNIKFAPLLTISPPVFYHYVLPRVPDMPRFPSITPAFTLPVGAERKLVSIFLPIGCAVLGMLVAAYLFIRDGHREKKHVRNYLE